MRTPRDREGARLALRTTSGGRTGRRSVARRSSRVKVRGSRRCVVIAAAAVLGLSVVGGAKLGRGHEDTGGDPRSGSGSSLGSSLGRRGAPNPTLLADQGGGLATAAASRSPGRVPPEALSSSIQLLAEFRLFDRIPEAAAILGDLRPIDDASMIDTAFAETVASPTPEGVGRLLTACRDEYAKRKMDAFNGRVSDRADSRESLQQIYLRMAIAVEQARVSGALTVAEADKCLWDLSTFTSFDEQDSLGDLFGAMVDRRLAESIEDEARWAATPLDQLDEESSDAASRHWVWAMLSGRMEDAAARGDEAAFKAYAERFLAIPHTGEDGEVLERYDRASVAAARDVLDRVLRAG